MRLLSAGSGGKLGCSFLQDPIEISSDEEVEAVEVRQPNGHEEGAGAFGLRRSTRSNAYKSTSVRFEV